MFYTGNTIGAKLPYEKSTVISTLTLPAGDYVIYGSSRVSKSVDAQYQLGIYALSNGAPSYLLDNAVIRSISMAAGGGAAITAVLQIPDSMTIGLVIYSLYNGTDLENYYTSFNAVRFR